MRKISANTPDDVLTKIGDGKLEIRGDSSTRFVVTVTDDEAPRLAARWAFWSGHMPEEKAGDFNLRKNPKLQPSEREFLLAWVHSEVKRIAQDHDSYEPAEEQWGPVLAEKLGVGLDWPLGPLIDEALELFGS